MSASAVPSVISVERRAGEGCQCRTARPDRDSPVSRSVRAPPLCGSCQRRAVAGRTPPSRAPMAPSRSSRRLHRALTGRPLSWSCPERRDRTVRGPAAGQGFLCRAKAPPVEGHFRWFQVVGSRGKPVVCWAVWSVGRVRMDLVDNRHPCKRRASAAGGLERTTSAVRLECVRDSASRQQSAESPWHQRDGAAVPR
jgi:hypothetical protein